MHARSFEEWALHFSPSVHAGPNPTQEFYLGRGGGGAVMPNQIQLKNFDSDCTRIDLRACKLPTKKILGEHAPRALLE